MKHRLFVALNLPESVLNMLGRIQADLRQELNEIPIRWTRIEGIHLTLKFLGDVEAASVNGIGERIREIASKRNPVPLVVRSIGVFPSLKRPRVLWSVVEGDVEALSRIQVELEEALEIIGFPRESRPFRPHLTLGRFRDYDSLNREPLKLHKLAIHEGHADDGLSFSVDSVSLISSELHRSGSIYTPLITETFKS